MKSAKKEKPNSAIARGFRLGKLGFNLAGSYLGYQAQNLFLGQKEKPKRLSRFQQKAALRVRDELGAMKGPAMKLGQMLSMQNEVLPEDFVNELASLQMQAPAMHPTLARAQFRSSLGKNPEELFRAFDPEPFAAASLGQVHRAVTRNGEKVAVKIQYPAIRSAIENDIQLLRSSTLPIQWTGHIPATLFEEIERGILEETDYLREADNLEFFAKGLSGLSHVSIPRVYRELSGDRVLTMSHLEGGTLNDLLKRNPSQAFRDELGFRLTELYETQWFCLKAGHADQHPGNYLFQTNGNIGLIDFGCVKHISFEVSELRHFYRKRAWRESEASARRFLILICGPDAPYARARKLLPLLEEWCDEFYPKNPGEDIVVDFRPGAKRKPKEIEIRRQIRNQSLRDKLINPEFAFLVRADMGFFHMLRQIGTRINFSEVERKVAAAHPATFPRSKP